MWRRHGVIGTLALALCASVAPQFAQAGDGLDSERLLPGQLPAAPVADQGVWLREPYDPFFDVDWSVALRGAYTKTPTIERSDTLLVPTVRLEHIGVRAAIAAEADAEIVREQDGRLSITGLRLGLDAGYDLDSVTRATATADLTLTQPLAGTPGVSSTVAIAPQTLSGSAGIGVTRQFGRFNVGVTGSVGRSLYGDTTRTDGTVVSNAEENLWSLDGALRVGYQVTPVFEVFGEAGVGRDLFDNPSTSLGVKTDATDVTLLAGVTGRWNSTLEATAATGVTLRRFDAAALGEVQAQVYDASVVFKPDPTLRLRAGLNTAVAPPGPDNAGTARVEYTASMGVDYTVNSWLALRAQAAWNTATFTGTGNTETGYSLGAGADYKVNAHTAIGADYSYSQAVTTSDGLQEAHRVTVGVTVSR
ncbi:outer membrane beta-barrel protein [Devosia albogilva]|uniref:Outer membrane beta-barrel protein n=1 Tax=Devosia albogilva TaxID=429726 RepID=A0ABW5QJC3_9HYPH